MNDDLTRGFENLFNDLIETRAEIIPIISEADEEVLLNGDAPDEIPILPLRSNVLYPGVVMPVTAGRKKSKMRKMEKGCRPK